MKIEKAKIENVTIGFNNRDMLIAEVNFRTSEIEKTSVEFILNSSRDVRMLTDLMKHLEVRKFEELNGKTVTNLNVSFLGLEFE